MATNGVLGMLFAAVGTVWMLITCANITKEKFDKALAKDVADSEES